MPLHEGGRLNFSGGGPHNRRIAVHLGSRQQAAVALETRAIGSWQAYSLDYYFKTYIKSIDSSDASHKGPQRLWDRCDSKSEDDQCGQR